MSEVQRDHLYTTDTGMVVDRHRLRLYEKIFTPLVVQATQRLDEVLARHEVHDNVPVIVAEPYTQIALVFVAHHLAYYHVVQGETAGTPWMVSF
jgi:hypothetical protein